jgi:pullulanase/glycogen debranching enzyme
MAVMLVTTVGELVVDLFTDKYSCCNLMIERKYFQCLWAQIMDSLQYIVDEFHIDGFCFKNTACLITGPHGQD